MILHMTHLPHRPEGVHSPLSPPMPLLLGLIGLIAPRFVIVGLWFMTTWFQGIFVTKLWPILGFIFLPLTLLWYSVVAHWYHGEWNTWRVIILVVAVLADVSSERSAAW